MCIRDRYAAVYARPRGYAYAVCLKAGGGPIGYINVEMDDSYDFGYALQRPFWGQGLVTEAGRAVVELSLIHIGRGRGPLLFRRRERVPCGRGSVLF